ncbi:ATPase [Heliorestis convoluta]|uniref:ATPase n=1 Tax=Heliorestis convoluta TaxID=356322 RepID=A0A5Q2N6B3_9FIRM|nr:ATPase [Heliorestis convoluta]QGG48105.1 ATPase [Heliorestis convoluta]
MERGLPLDGSRRRGGENKLQVSRIIDELENMIATSSRIPMTGKVLVDDQLILNYLDRIRTALPEEIQQAKWLTKERQRVIQDAEDECQRMIEETKSYVNKLSSETEVYRLAQSQSEEILAKAKQEADELKQGACNYADDVLQQMEHLLTRAATTVRKGRDELKMESERDLDRGEG